MIGMGVAEMKPLENEVDGSLIWVFEFKSIFKITYVQGMSRMVSSFVWNMLSDYDPVTGIGSTFLKLLAAPIVYDTDKEVTVVLLSEEMDSLEKRFKAFQAKAGQNIPLAELLDKALILGVDIDTNTTSGPKVDVRFSLYDKLGRKAFIQT